MPKIYLSIICHPKFRHSKSCLVKHHISTFSHSFCLSIEKKIRRSRSGMPSKSQQKETKERAFLRLTSHTNLQVWSYQVWDKSPLRWLMDLYDLLNKWEEHLLENGLKKKANRRPLSINLSSVDPFSDKNSN